MKIKPSKIRVKRKDDLYTIYYGGRVWAKMIIENEELEDLLPYDVQQLVVAKFIENSNKPTDEWTLINAYDVGTAIERFIFNK